MYDSNGVVGAHHEALTEDLTIVIGRKGSFGEVNLSHVPCWPIDTTYYVDRTATNADLRWLAYRLSSLGLKKLNKAAAIPGLNREDAYRQRLLLPPLAEQRRIADILDRTESLRAKRRVAIARVDELMQAIFVEMFGDAATNPMEWPRVRLGDLCEKVIDCPHLTPVYAREPSKYICLRSSDIQNSEIDLSAAKCVDEHEYKERIA